MNKKEKKELIDEEDKTAVVGTTIYPEEDDY